MHTAAAIASFTAAASSAVIASSVVTASSVAVASSDSASPLSWAAASLGPSQAKPLP